jgi:hypothetical protein
MLSLATVAALWSQRVSLHHQQIGEPRRCRVDEDEGLSTYAVAAVGPRVTGAALDQEVAGSQKCLALAADGPHLTFQADRDSTSHLRRGAASPRIDERAIHTKLVSSAVHLRVGRPAEV